MITIPDTQLSEIDFFVLSLKNTPKSGLHNPFKNIERYLMLGEVSWKASEVLRDPDVFNFFVDLTIRAAPKSRK